MTKAMNDMTKATINAQLRGDAPSLGGWLTIANATTAEVVARSGLDYVCVDTQHGAIDFTDSVAMVAAITFGGSSPIVRVPRNEPGIIGKSLDAGAHGVIIPMVNTAEEAEAAASACRYAPRGNRSWGPTVASLRTDYLAWEPGNVACIPMIETAEAIENLDDILKVPDIDAIYVGPADLSITLGLPPQNNDGAPAFDDALSHILERCAVHNIVAGIQANGALAQRRLNAGFKMVTIATDLQSIQLGLTNELALARGETQTHNRKSVY